MPQERFREGTKLSQGYILQQKLGVGGFGEVFSATDESDQSTVAIKLFKISSEPQTDERYKKLFLREAKIISRLRHPNIVPFYWYGTEQVRGQQNPEQIEEHPYIVMAYANEGSVKSFIQQHGGVTTEQAIDFLVQAANGLQYAHDRRVLHRDIKPDNLLLHKEHPKQDHLDLWVTDFGIAVTAHPLYTQSPITPQQPIGTPAYEAPEQSEGVAQNPSDIYSFGVVAYELFTGRRPFSASTAIQYYFAHKDKTPPSFAEARGQQGMNETLALLEEVVMKALAKDPANRPESIQVFALTLKETNVKALERAKEARRIIDLAALETQKDIVQQASQVSDERRRGQFAIPPTQPALSPTEPEGFPQQEEGKQKDRQHEALRVNELIQQGKRESSQGNYEAALTFLDQAIQLDPKNLFAFLDKGIMLGKLERDEEALDAFDQVIRLKPVHNSTPFSWKGYTLSRLGRYEEALEAYDQSLQIFPKDEITLGQKGDVLEKLGRYEEALAAFKKAKKHSYFSKSFYKSKIKSLREKIKEKN